MSVGDTGEVLRGLKERLCRHMLAPSHMYISHSSTCASALPTVRGVLKQYKSRIYLQHFIAWYILGGFTIYELGTNGNRDGAIPSASYASLFRLVMFLKSTLYVRYARTVVRTVENDADHRNRIDLVR